MNVIVSNLNKDTFSSLNVDIIKAINGEFTADEITQSFSNFFFNRMFLDITAIKDYTDVKNIQKLSLSLDVSKIIILLNDNEVVNSNEYKAKLVSMGIYNFTNDLVGLKYLYDNPNSYKDVAQYQEFISDVDESVQSTLMANSFRVIAFKNATMHAGATSLIYMMKKELATRYKVVAIEVNKRDFFYFNDKDMISVDINELGNTVFKYKDCDIVLIDLNDGDDSLVEGDSYYLIDPSTIKINKMLLTDRGALERLVNKNVIVNMSILSDDDIRTFEKEANVKVFYNLGPMSDKVNNSDTLLPFLEKLGLIKRVESNTINDDDDDNNNHKSSSKSLFGFFKK